MFPLTDGSSISDVLEASRQCCVLLKHLPVFAVCGGANATQFPGRQQWLELVRCVHRHAGGRTGANQRMNLVNEQDRVLGRSRSSLRMFFTRSSKSPAEARACHQSCRCSDDSTVEEASASRRYCLSDNPPCQAFRQCRLANPRLAHQDNIVLAAPTQGTNDLGHLLLTPDQRVNHASLGALARSSSATQCLKAALRWKIEDSGISRRLTPRRGFSTAIGLL